jgi:NADH dehydrogenase
MKLKGWQLHGGPMGAARFLRCDPVARPNADKLVTIIGGSGFVGRNIVRSLAKRGYRIRVACRRPDLAGHVLPLGTPGQIALVQANVRFPQSLAAACAGAYAVVNATGTDHSAGSQTFEAVISFGAEAVARAARAAKAEVMIMISGIGAAATSESAAARAKAEGEANTTRAFPGAMLLRPSVIFGPDDRFFNRLAAMARLSPVLPLFGGGETRYQPVFAGDVAEAVATLIDDGACTGKTYELGGPEVASLRDLTQFALDTTYRKRLLLPVPWGLARLMGSILGLVPGKPLTADQIDLLRHDNVVSASAKADGRTLEGLRITPRSYRAVVPSYLYRFRKEGQFTVPSGTPQ